jgi:GGDEF domain-containing protein
MIRLFTQQGDGAEVDAHLRLRILRLLAHALELNLLEGRGLPAEEIKTSLARLAASLENKDSEPAVLEAARASSQAIQQYFQRLSRSLDSLAGDLRQGIRALEDAIAIFDGEQVHQLSRLEAIGKTLGQPKGVDDLKLLQEQFEDCLTAFRQSHSRSSQQLQQACWMLRESGRHVPATETNLAFAVVHLNRLDLIRDRFGPAMAQTLTCFFLKTLAARWPSAEASQALANDAFLLIDSQNLNLDHHRQQLRRLATERLVYSATHEDREYLLPIAFDWMANHAATREQARVMAEAFLFTAKPLQSSPPDPQ